MGITPVEDEKVTFGKLSAPLKVLVVISWIASTLVLLLFLTGIIQGAIMATQVANAMA